VAADALRVIACKLTFQAPRSLGTGASPRGQLFSEQYFQAWAVKPVGCDGCKALVVEQR